MGFILMKTQILFFISYQIEINFKLCLKVLNYQNIFQKALRISCPICHISYQTCNLAYDHKNLFVILEILSNYHLRFNFNYPLGCVHRSTWFPLTHRVHLLSNFVCYMHRLKAGLDTISVNLCWTCTGKR